MNAITPFVFEGTHVVRTVSQKGEPWFVVIDVCRCVGIQNPTMAVANLDEDEVSALSLTEGSSNGVQQAREFIVVSEGGLYTLILRSRKATTPGTVQHRFRKWVTSEVLPSIRKTGGYGQQTNLKSVTSRVALMNQALRLTGKLQVTRNRAERRMMHSFLEGMCLELGINTPPLDQLGHDAPEPPDLVAAFWREVEDIQAQGTAINHAHSKDLMALRMVELRRHLSLAINKNLRDALKADPRFVANKTVNSAITGGAVKCWVFRA